MSDTDPAATGCPFSPRPNRDYADDYARLRADCPLAWSDDFGGFWTLTRHEDVSRTARDWRRFQSGRPFVEFPDLPRSIPISLNPPEHTDYRQFLNRYFTPERVQALRPAVEAIIADALDPLIAAGEGDIAPAVAQVVPVRVLAAFLGLGEDGQRALRANLALEVAAAGDPARINALQQVMWDAPVEATIAERRRAPGDPATDLISGVLAWERNGAPLPHEDVKAIAIQIFSAGAGTTVRAITSVCARLAGDAGAQARLRADRDLIAPLIEEVLRLSPPLHHVARQPVAETVIHGVAVPAGGNVALNFAAANRDEARFDRPADFDLSRSPNPHLTFGSGVHQCIGAPIARLELAVLVGRLLDRTTRIWLAEAPQRVAMPLRSGFRSVRLRFEAA